MDRRALLLYLQNVRDLEAAKYRLNAKRNALKPEYDKKIQQIRTEPKYLPLQTNDMNATEPSGIFMFCIVALIICVVLMIVMFSALSTGSKTAGSYITLSFFGLIIFGLLAYNKRPESYKVLKEQNDAITKQVLEYNERETVIAKMGQDKCKRLKEEWKEKDSQLRLEIDKVSAALADFYSMNILASPYRNLASAIYIYDYMATSQTSLEDTLIHERIENGIQRLEERIDRVLNSLDDYIYETRCLQAENRAAVERTIAQNNQMLKALQSSADSAAEAAQYAELSANYGKANACFSLANYLK